MKRKVCVLTGSRAEYGVLKSVMRAIQTHPSLELSIIATGMHLLLKFGYTVKEIENDGFKINRKVEMYGSEDTKGAMIKSVGKGIIGITEALEEIKPNILVVLGDRGEPLAGAIAAAYMEIPVAHIAGGDITSRLIDGPIRHSITKFAHIHLTNSKKSAWRVKMMGEEPWRIFVVGAAGVDNIVNDYGTSKEDLVRKYNLNLNEKLALMVQHPTLEDEEAPKQIEKTLKVLSKLDLESIIIFPNADAGGRRMVNVIEKFSKTQKLKIYANIPHKDYIGLMKIADVLVGNSSSGIVEAPSAGLPVVNIGPRQEGRERANNTVDVGYNASEIEKAIEKCLYDKGFISIVKKCQTPYGDGTAGIRIAKILSEIKLDKKLLDKKITYI